MRNKISAIIFDKEKDNHDYSTVRTNYDDSYMENDFDLYVSDNGEEIHNILNNFRGFDTLVTIGSPEDYGELFSLPYDIRKRWINEETFDGPVIASDIIANMKFNIERKEGNSLRKFSVFTCAFNTPKDVFLRLYNSLLAQTYKEWNWWILDDSTTDDVINTVDEINDYRIHLIRNHTNHGNIGFNKHVIAMACDGDYLMEIDHDDELTPDCMELVSKAFTKYPDTDFVYSDAWEEIGGQTVHYGEGWGYGYGTRRTQVINGEEISYERTPDVNAVTIRVIYAEPNHVRCWKRDFYHKINGHNPTLSVLDDQDILIRTFLYGKMCKVDKVLYIQHEGESERGVGGDTTQSKRFKEIQRTTWILKERYDTLIHERCMELGVKDPIWRDEGYGDLGLEHEKVEPINYIYEA